jgi:hypothetical protein
MSLLITCLMAIALWLSPIALPAAHAASLSALGVLPGLEGVFAGKTPALGVEDGPIGGLSTDAQLCR